MNIHELSKLVMRFDMDNSELDKWTNKITRIIEIWKDMPEMATELNEFSIKIQKELQISCKDYEEKLKSFSELEIEQAREYYKNQLAKFKEN